MNNALTWLLFLSLIVSASLAQDLKKAPPYVIGFSNAGQGDVWLTTMLHTAEQAAAQHKDAIKRFIVRDAGHDNARQIEQINELAAENIDLLIINANNSEKDIDDAVSQIYQKGIPVVMVVRRIQSDNFTTFVTGSSEDLGQTMAFWIVEKLQGKGNVVLLPGVKGASPAEARLQAALSVFKLFPDIRILATKYTGWDPQKGEEIMDALLQKHPNEIDAVFADSGLQGMGAMRAFIKAGYKKGIFPPITCGDVNGCLRLAIEHDIPSLNYDFSPNIGRQAVEFSLKLLEGEKLPHIRVVRSPIYITEGDETPSIKAIGSYQEYYVPGLPDDAMISHDLGNDYDPKTFRADYPR